MCNRVVKIFILVLIILVVLYLGYFVIKILGNLKSRESELDDNKKVNYFAILIAARNEEKVIGNLIDSLKKQDYPEDKYKIYVIVNNCTDNTEKVAKKRGASIIKGSNRIRTKGNALEEAFDYLKDNTEIDGYIIFDADNVANRDFLKNMNTSMNMGYGISQGFRDTKNISDSYVSTSFAILYYMQSIFINKVRYNAGMSSFLNGTGIMIKKNIIDEYGYHPLTVTEDVEYTMVAAIKGVKIGYTEGAIFYDEQVTSFRESLKQRKRWSYGTIDCIKKYGRELLRGGIKGKNSDCIDVFIFELCLFLQVLTSILGIVILVMTVINFEVSHLIAGFATSVIMYIIGVVFRIILLKKMKKSVRDNIGGILLFDWFLMSWVIATSEAIFARNYSWEPTKHNRSIAISEMEK